MAAMTAPLPMTRGRRVALAIGVPLCLILVANAGLSLVANLGRGSYPVSYTAPAAARSLTLSSSGGQITVTGTASGRARVAGTAHYSLVRARLTEHATASGAVVSYDCSFPWGSCGLDAAVTLPSGMPAAMHTAGGNVRVTGTDGPVTLSTSGGDLSISRVAGPLTMNTSGGNIGGTAVTSAAVTAHTSGGNIDITFAGVPHDVHVSTSGGNVTLVLPPGDTQYHVTAGTSGGTVTDTVPQNTASLNVITATTSGGDITIRQQ